LLLKVNFCFGFILKGNKKTLMRMSCSPSRFQYGDYKNLAFINYTSVEEIEIEEVIPTRKKYSTILILLQSKDEIIYNDFKLLRKQLPIPMEDTFTPKVKLLLFSNC
jgi:hypothetical protein